MRKVLSYFSLAVMMIPAVCSCIKNDLPYPVVVPAIQELSAEGTDKIEIDGNASTVTLTLNECTDIRNVKITSVAFKDEITKMSPSIIGTFDLRKPLPFVLTTYSDYKWRVVAQQEILRSFAVAGQVGEAVIDVPNKRIVAYVSDKMPLTALQVTQFRLAPESIAEYDRDIFSIHDFTDIVEISVKTHGRVETWRIIVEQKEVQVEFSSVDAWTRVCWMSAVGIAGEKNGFCYRKVGEEDWIDVSGAEITENGGSFSTCLEGLEPLTEYECYAYSGSMKGTEVNFTTEADVQLPNASFEEYSNAESKKYQSWYDPSSFLWNEKWWDSGNVASAEMVGENGLISAPDTQDKKVGNASAKLMSKYILVKLAAGNLFCGEFAQLIGTEGGIVNFGRPFTTRPRAMKLWLKYNCGIVDYVVGMPAGDNVKIGDNDRCQVMIAVGDWNYKKFGGTPESPVSVNTTKPETYFNSKSEGVIGYGTLILNQSTDGWVEVEIPLEYVSTSRKPTHIIVMCSSTLLGDYFTGSSKSTLWVDDMRLIY